MTADFSYITSSDGFTSICPNNSSAENCYNAIFADGAYRLMPHELTAFKSQARNAGYSVTKSKPVKIDYSDDLLAELTV